MIRCLIVDDEPIAIRVLTSHLEKIPDVEIAATCMNAVEAVRIVREDAIDLVFLDIEMPALTGIGFVESFDRPPRFIFTTAHREYAVRGFELDAVDYLLKPIRFPRLLRAVEKVHRLRRETSGAAPRSPGSINVRIDRRTVRVDLGDIIYIESLGDYVVIHTPSTQYTAKLRISDLEEELAPRGFVRIHRSYIISIDKVESFTSSEVQLGRATLPVSRTYRREVLDVLGDGAA